MKKLLLMLISILSVSSITLASEGNANTVRDYVLNGYNVGFTVDRNCVLGADFHMWSVGDDDLVIGQYVAYSLEDNAYYYITQDTAQTFLEEEE